MIRVVMIVRNEAKCLPAILEGCAWADEICVIDTGSTDATPDLLEAARPLVRWARSRHFGPDTAPQDFRFNVARNEAIDFAGGERDDWCVSMDADDQPAPEAGPRIQALARAPARAVYGFVIEYGQLRFYQHRMWPVGYGVGWNAHMSCHEFLEVQGLPVLTRAEITIRHTWARKEGRVARNVGILERDYYLRGQATPRHLFYLGQAYRDAGRWLESAQFFRQYLAVGDWKEQRYFARLFMARCLAQIPGKTGDAWQAALTAVAEDPERAEAYCELGDLATSLGEPGQGICWYQHALALGGPPAHSMLFTEIDRYRDYPLQKIVKIQEGAEDGQVRTAVRSVQPGGGIPPASEELEQGQAAGVQGPAHVPRAEPAPANAK